MKKLFRFLIVIVFLNLIQFCFVGCPGRSIENIYFEFEKPIITNLDNSGSSPIESIEEIPAKAYALGLNLKLVEISRNFSCEFFHSSNILNATSIEDEKYFLKDSLELINIYDLIYFNNKYPGTNNKIFFDIYKRFNDLRMKYNAHPDINNISMDEFENLFNIVLPNFDQNIMKQYKDWIFLFL